MKRLRIPFFILIFALGLSTCGNSAGDGVAERNGRPIAGEAEPGGRPIAGEAEPGGISTAGETEPDGVSTAGTPDHGLAASADGAEGEAYSDEHSHLLSEGNNIVEHEATGYCGNTVTTVSREAWAGGEPWEVSFWGSDSVALTDLLLYLDYSGDTCRCQPEYAVDTEFGAGYGINLTEGYVRHDGGQVSLTAEQIGQIQEILDRQTAGE